jgi:hypothetical protein
MEQIFPIFYASEMNTTLNNFVLVLFFAFCLQVPSGTFADEEYGPDTIVLYPPTIPANVPTDMQIMTVPRNALITPDSLTVVQVDTGGQVLKTLATMTNNRMYKATVTFNEPAGKTLNLQVIGHYKGRPDVPSRISSLYVEESGAADKILSEIAKDLRAGDFDHLSTYFLDPSQGASVFKSLSAESRKQLASDFEHAKFSRGTGTTRVYAMTIHKADGTADQTEIDLEYEGKWVVVGW